MNRYNEEYLRILNSEFALRKSKNKRYSLRSYAKFLGIHHSTLSQVMSRQKGLSTKMSIKLANRLGLNFLEKNKFLTSVTKWCSRSPERRKQAAERLAILAKHQVGTSEIEEALEIDHASQAAVFEVIQNATLCVDQQDLPAAKLMIREFTQKFCLQFNSEIASKSSRLYSFSINFFQTG